MTFPDQFSGGLRRAGLPQRVHVPADGDLPPHAGPGLLREAAPRVHHQHAVGCEPVHVAVGVLPLCSFFLRAEVQGASQQGTVGDKKMPCGTALPVK